jgi:hypothetical protein
MPRRGAPRDQQDGGRPPRDPPAGLPSAICFQHPADGNRADGAPANPAGAIVNKVDYPAGRFAELVESFGSDEVLGSICRADWAGSDRLLREETFTTYGRDWVEQAIVPLRKRIAEVARGAEG